MAIMSHFDASKTIIVLGLYCNSKPINITGHESKYNNVIILPYYVWNILAVWLDGVTIVQQQKYIDMWTT